jgi:hypothetical protein
MATFGVSGLSGRLGMKAAEHKINPWEQKINPRNRGPGATMNKGPFSMKTPVKSAWISTRRSK